MTSMLKEVPAPVGGWNARDAFANMKPTDAVLLDNFVPEASQVVLRKGHTSHLSGLGGSVETLLEFRDETNLRLVAAANGNLWNATSAATSLGSGYSNNRWQGVMMNGNLALVNGADTPQKYDGTSLSTLSTTGPTATDIVGVHVHKSRSYFWTTNSSSFWYSAVNTLGGTITEFDLSRIGNGGGKLLFMQSWSRDAGNGADDLAVFVMTSGEVFIYAGSDPGDAADWSLSGVFQIGQPIGIRSHLKVGGDLIIGTYDGYIPLSSVLSEGRFSKGSAISDKIRKAVQKDTNSYRANFGWDAVYYPKGNKVFFNVPLVEDSTYQQHVFNTITKSWCRYTGLAARCWVVYNDDIYFGGNAEIFKAENGNNDNGSDIQGDAIPAFNYMGSRGKSKKFNAVQHVLASEGTLPVETKMGVDFSYPNLSFTSSSFSAAGSSWDTATWDVDEWAGTGDSQIVDAWKSVFGLGYSGSARLRIATSNQEVNWFATNYLFETGGIV